MLLGKLLRDLNQLEAHDPQSAFLKPREYPPRQPPPNRRPTASGLMRINVRSVAMNLLPYD
jgi:hypothetical protein